MARPQTSNKALGAAAGGGIGWAVASIVIAFWPELAEVGVPIAELATFALATLGVYFAPANRPR